ncbi:MAG: hypothetical protein U0974_10950 [Gemmatimonadales bacterium]|nr:hypothetical protein [Gemmatimonadales bacterium]MDZ4390230.1 hypothetical protein [Gemmatimonadales bacterium]
MRPLVLVGIVVFALGAFVMWRGASVTSQRDVLQVGDVKITADEQQSVPPWLGGVAMVAGVVLIVVGVRKPA